MKKFWIIVVAILVLNLSSCVYKEGFKKKEIYRESSPDGAYTVVFYQVGQPGWPFGPVKAQIKLCNKRGRTIDKLTLSINNDGGQLFKSNIRLLQWRDSVVELHIKGADDDVATAYTLTFKK